MCPLQLILIWGLIPGITWALENSILTHFDKSPFNNPACLDDSFKYNNETQVRSTRQSFQVFKQLSELPAIIMASLG